MYTDVSDFNLEDFDLISIKEIVDENKTIDTFDIEVDNKHYFYVRNPDNASSEFIVSHNTAEICFGDPKSEEYLDLKDYKKNPNRESHGWASNNSVYADIGMDYSSCAERTINNGEPGYIWLDNIQKYSRMDGVIDWKDKRVVGCNPCLVGGTKIYTELGEITIKELVNIQNNGGKVPKIYTMNETTKDVELDTPINCFKSGENLDVIKIETEDSEIVLTSNHKVFVENKGWIEAKDISVDDVVLEVEIKNMETIKVKRARVKKVTIESNEDVYDIQMQKNHNFFANKILVHNCGEQSLESYELCCLVETFPHRADSMEDYLRTLKFAYLYAKTVTLGQTHWPETNRVMLRNRRIGCSMSGIQQFITKNGINELKTWMIEGYKTIRQWDEQYSEWLAIPRSIKVTSIKPSGTVSLLAGATPGMHWPESRYYIRRVRLAKDSELISPLKKNGYHIEDDVTNPKHTCIVEIPVDIGEGVRVLKDVSIWEQLSLAAFIQKYWSDNQVSCTVTINTDTEKEQLKYALDYFQYQLKGISFLPRTDKGTFPQMPYEEITQEQYDKKSKNIKKIKFGRIHNEQAEVEKFCENDVCILKNQEEAIKKNFENKK